MCAYLGMHELTLGRVSVTGLGSACAAVGSTRLEATRVSSEQEGDSKVASCCWWTGNVSVPERWPLARMRGLSAALSGPGVALLPSTWLAHSSDPSGHSSYGSSKYVAEGNIAESSKVVTFFGNSSLL